jgi:hypothetical protein
VSAVHTTSMTPRKDNDMHDIDSNFPAVQSTRDAPRDATTTANSPIPPSTIKTNGGPPAAPSRPLPQATGQSLHYGTAETPVARIEPDDRWPRMWRMIGADGQMSDIANLSRIRDAAAAVAERGPPGRNRRRFHWKIAHREPRSSSRGR